jgi:hypothetical protein
LTPRFRAQKSFAPLDDKPSNLSLFDESSLANLFESKSNNTLQNVNYAHTPRELPTYRSLYNPSRSLMYGDEEKFGQYVPNLAVSKTPRSFVDNSSGLDPLTSRSFTFVKERRPRLNDFY